MGAGPIHSMGGKTVRWTYEDGPMKGKAFEHRFSNDGTVSWKKAAARSHQPIRAPSTSSRRSTTTPTCSRISRAPASR
jgi:hypothetical protein